MTFIMEHQYSTPIMILIETKSHKNFPAKLNTFISERINEYLAYSICHVPSYVAFINQRSRVPRQKGPTRHAYAWQIGPFWQDTLEMRDILFVCATYVGQFIKVNLIGAIPASSSVVYSFGHTSTSFWSFLSDLYLWYPCIWLNNNGFILEICIVLYWYSNVFRWRRVSLLSVIVIYVAIYLVHGLRNDPQWLHLKN